MACRRRAGRVLGRCANGAGAAEDYPVVVGTQRSASSAAARSPTCAQVSMECTDLVCAPQDEEPDGVSGDVERQKKLRVLMGAGVAHAARCRQPQKREG